MIRKEFSKVWRNRMKKMFFYPFSTLIFFSFSMSPGVRFGKNRTLFSMVCFENDRRF